MNKEIIITLCARHDLGMASLPNGEDECKRFTAEYLRQADILSEQMGVDITIILAEYDSSEARIKNDPDNVIWQTIQDMVEW